MTHQCRINTNGFRLLMPYIGGFVLGLAATVSSLTAAEVDFETEVLPILEERCFHCHGEDEQESALRLDSRTGMLRGGDSGLAAVVAGKPEESYLLELVRHLDEGMEMPPDDDPLPANEIALIEKWISEGAVWPGQMDSVDKAEVSDHWSFQPVRRPVVPANDETNPIDAFIARTIARCGVGFWYTS